MDQPRRSRSHCLSTWRYLGRVAFHTDPDHRCLPPPDNPDAVRAWSEGYRIAWCAYYDRLPSSPIDRVSLEAEIRGVLQGDDEGNACDHPSAHRPRVRLH